MIPVVVAALTAAATILLTRASDAANRRRHRYAAAFRWEGFEPHLLIRSAHPQVFHKTPPLAAGAPYGL